MPIIERVAWDHAGPEEIAYRFPKLTLKFGSQVIVMENQWAVFFRDGKAYDIFGPGRHQNPIPSDLGLSRMKSGESSMEVRRGSDVQFVPLTWA